jgi:hypothetical protein
MSIHSHCQCLEYRTVGSFLSGQEKLPTYNIIYISLFGPIYHTFTIRSFGHGLLSNRPGSCLVSLVSFHDLWSKELSDTRNDSPSKLPPFSLVMSSLTTKDDALGRELTSRIFLSTEAPAVVPFPIKPRAELRFFCWAVFFAGLSSTVLLLLLLWVSSRS